MKIAFLFFLSILPLLVVGQSFNFQKIETNSSLINSLCIDNKNNKWLATEKGLFIIDDKNKITNLTTNNSQIALNYLNTIYIDDKSNIWLGTYAKGLIKKTDNDFKVFPFKKGEECLINSIKIIKNKVFVTTLKGVFTLSTKSDNLERISHNSKLYENVYCLLEDNNTYLLATSSGVFQKNKKIGNLKQVKSICKFKNSIWAGENTGNGINLMSLKKNKWNSINQNFFIKNSKFEDINKLIPDTINNCIWIATNGLLVYSNNQIISFSEDVNFDSNYVNDISVDNDGYVWIVTADKGLFKVTIENETPCLKKDNVHYNGKDLKKGDTITINSLPFQMGEAFFSRDIEKVEEIKELANFLTKNKCVKIEIIGYAGAGSRLFLARDRANVVIKSLKDIYKISSDRISKSKNTKVAIDNTKIEIKITSI